MQTLHLSVALLITRMRIEETLQLCEEGLQLLMQDSEGFVPSLGFLQSSTPKTFKFHL